MAGINTTDIEHKHNNIPVVLSKYNDSGRVIYSVAKDLYGNITAIYCIMNDELRSIKIKRKYSNIIVRYKGYNI